MTTPKLNRHRRILAIIRGSTRAVSAEVLAAATDVSVRSIYRDLAAMKTAGAPIIGEAGIGYRLDEAPRYRLDLSVEDVCVLHAALERSVAEAAGHPRARRLLKITERLEGAIPFELLRPVAVEQEPEPLRAASSRAPAPSPVLFKVGDVLRYAEGPTALMQVTKVSPGYGGSVARYAGRQCLGGMVGAYHRACREANTIEMAMWRSTARQRGEGQVAP